MKYEITIHQYEEFTEAEKQEFRNSRNRDFISDTKYPSYHEQKKTIRVVNAELTEEEYKAIKKAVIDII